VPIITFTFFSLIISSAATKIEILYQVST